MHIQNSFLRHRKLSVIATVVLLFCAGRGWGDTYNPATAELSIPAVSVGGATYFNVVVSISGVVSGPTGLSANGGEDSFDTVSGQLTIPSVNVGSATYYNVIANVKRFISIGRLRGADTYSANLTIPFVQVGGTVYHDVVVAVGSVIQVMHGIPNTPRDVYDPSAHQLTIPAVQAGNHVYTNVVITPGAIMSVGGVSPQVTLAPNVINLDCNNSSAGCEPGIALLINSGTSILNISNIMVSNEGANSGIFSFTDNCHAVLNAGQSCNISVYFTADVLGHYTGSLIVSDDGAGSPHSATLFGYGHN